MPIAPLRLIKNATEYVPKSKYLAIPVRCRGIYVLYVYNGRTGSYRVVYIGMAAKENAGIRRRIISHIKSKANQWMVLPRFRRRLRTWDLSSF